LVPRQLTCFTCAAVFSFATPASCSILSCINVIAEAVCIADAIDNEDWKNIFTCAKQKEVRFRLLAPISSRPMDGFSSARSLSVRVVGADGLWWRGDRSATALGASVRWADFWRSTVFAERGWSARRMD
jgi:hypothetical protein